MSDKIFLSETHFLINSLPSPIWVLLVKVPFGTYARRVADTPLWFLSSEVMTDARFEHASSG